MASAPVNVDVRPTQRCNARCEYCSAGSSSSGARMSVQDFKKAVRFLRDTVFPAMGVSSDGPACRVNWLGGELMTIPHRDLAEMVWFADDCLSDGFIEFNQVAQTNLIGSPRRVSSLLALFKGEVGTSIESFGEQRTVRGSAAAYKRIFSQRQEDVRRLVGRRLPVIFVIDRRSAAHVSREVEAAESGGYGIQLKHAYEGSSAVDALSPGEIADIYETHARQWVMQGTVFIEPFFSLLAAQVTQAMGEDASLVSGCPNQTDCARRNINIEANGDMYLCFDLADVRYGNFGNAVAGVFDRDAWERVASEASRLPEGCAGCEYLVVCRGGCMADRVREGGAFDASPPYCVVKKRVLGVFKESIAHHGAANVRSWLRSIDSGLCTSRLLEG